MSASTFFDYISQLTINERKQLGAEINYSGAYITLQASVRKNLSEVFVLAVLESKFNRAPHGSKEMIVTRKMADDCIAYLREQRRLSRKKQVLAGKKKNTK